MWRSVTFCIAVRQLSEPKKCHPDCLRSILPLVAAWSVVVIGNALTCSFSRNVPLFHMSTQRLDTSLHVISFTRPSPALVLQVTNAWVRRPGYEASTLQKKKGCFDSIWLPEFHTSSASLNTVETHCLLYIPNSDEIF